jgi:aspartate-semialdehyde dehydrogenase
VIPQVDSFGPNGYTGEETKMMLESRKIMGLPDLKVIDHRARAGRAGALGFGQRRV